MKFAPWVIIIYMLAALCWWTYLLYSKNDIIYRQQITVLELKETINNDSIAELKDDFDRQKKMIIGEGVVFGLALICGIFFLGLMYRKDIKNTEKQNNFLLAVTHELKSPLSSIKLAFETIQKRTLKREQYETIAGNGIIETDRLHKQLENILDATSIDNRYYLDKSQISLKDLVDHIRSQRANSVDENRVIYTFDNPSDALKEVEVDIHGILKITKNLIENALKYSYDQVSAIFKIKENMLVIQIIDCGPGIPDNEKGNVFKRFYRLGNEETRNSTGTGLGLFIVRQIVQKNKGKITITDNKPKGTIFTVELNSK